MNVRSLPARPSLELDKKAAKRLLRAARAGDAEALARIAEHHPRFATAAEVASDELRLADVELVLAREYGFLSWPRYKHFVEALRADRGTRAATLVQAVCGNQLARGLALLEREPDLACFNFHVACACGELSVVEQGLEKDPGLAQRAGGPEGWQPLVYTCFSRFWRRDPERAERLFAIAQLLLLRGADPNSHFLAKHEGEREIQTCLYAAAGIANNAELTALLLTSGARVDESPQREALYHASEFRNVSCLRLLLDAKPLPAAVTYCFGRALDFDNEPAALLYLEHGADPNYVVPWHQHRSHLHKAVRQGRSLKVLRMMLERGADPNLADANGNSPYQLALERGERDIAVLLEQFGASLVATAAPAKPHSELLTQAARRNDLLEIERLLAAGVDVSAAVDLPPLHAACYAGQLPAARLLFAHGASLTQLSDYGATPLGTCIHGSSNCCDVEGGPGTLMPEEVPARDYVELAEWLIAQGSELPKSIWGGSEAVQEALRRHGVPDAT
jgi:hypothetical protein